MSIKNLKNDVINWHQQQYPLIDNSPNEKSLMALHKLCEEILIPIQRNFDDIHITYGFTSLNLLKQIRRINPAHTAPQLDQHASHETNTRNNIICSRVGASCDIFVKGFESNMYQIAKWAADNLPFDRMYLYGNDRPIHLSYGPEHSRFIQVMNTRKDGKRLLGKKGKSTNFNSIIGNDDES